MPLAPRDAVQDAVPSEQLVVQYSETAFAEERSTGHGYRRTGPTPDAVQDAIDANLFWTRVIFSKEYWAAFGTASARMLCWFLGAAVFGALYSLLLRLLDAI
jgi:hypothetical protein